MIVLPPTELPSSPDTADIQGMREHNSALVVRLLWNESGGLSRADVSRRLGLSRSTVSAIVEGLVASGIILESHRANSTGGRRGIVLRFNDTHRNIIGIDMGATHVSAALTDLRGRVLSLDSMDADVQNDPAGTLQALEHIITSVLDNAQAPVLGMGVGVPCPVDRLSPSQLCPRILPAWRGIQLGDHLHERFRLPVWMDNDANMGALAEAWWGSAVDVGDFAYIKVATGIGAGFIINGLPYRGASGIAGEIGHTTVNVDGRLCRCGLRGCLEAEAGTPAVLEKAQDIGLLKPSDEPLGRNQALQALIHMASEGDPDASELVASVGRHIGIAISNLLNILNPRLIVLGGRLTSAGDFLLEHVRDTVRSRTLSTSIDNADIVLGKLGSEHIALGAATLVLHHALLDHRRLTERPTSSTRPFTPQTQTISA